MLCDVHWWLERPPRRGRLVLVCELCLRWAWQAVSTGIEWARCWFKQGTKKLASVSAMPCICRVPAPLQLPPRQSSDLLVHLKQSRCASEAAPLLERLEQTVLLRPSCVRALCSSRARRSPLCTQLWLSFPAPDGLQPACCCRVRRRPLALPPAAKPSARHPRNSDRALHQPHPATLHHAGRNRQRDAAGRVDRRAHRRRGGVAASAAAARAHPPQQRGLQPSFSGDAGHRAGLFGTVGTMLASLRQPLPVVGRPVRSSAFSAPLMHSSCLFARPVPTLLP